MLQSKYWNLGFDEFFTIKHKNFEEKLFYFFQGIFLHCLKFLFLSAIYWHSLREWYKVSCAMLNYVINPRFTVNRLKINPRKFHAFCSQSAPFSHRSNLLLLIKNFFTKIYWGSSLVESDEAKNALWVKNRN